MSTNQVELEGKIHKLEILIDDSHLYLTKDGYLSEKFLQTFDEAGLIANELKYINLNTLMPELATEVSGILFSYCQLGERYNELIVKNSEINTPLYEKQSENIENDNNKLDLDEIFGGDFENESESDDETLHSQSDTSSSKVSNFFRENRLVIGICAGVGALVGIVTPIALTLNKTEDPELED